ncbi:hypothetical protein Ancab_011383 [Ancistrocladus abbreviatus]
MAARQQGTSATSNRVYEDFEPSTSWVRKEGVDTFLLNLPDFKKEQLRVQLTSSRFLRISGECPVRDNKWKRFVKEVPVAPDCDTKEITAKFEDGILYIRQPKLITPAEQQDQVKPTVETPKPQQPPLRPPPTPPPTLQVPSLPPPQEKQKDGDDIPRKSEETQNGMRPDSKDFPPKTAEQKMGEKEVGPKEEGRGKREEEEKRSKTVDDDARKMEEVTKQKEIAGTPEAEGGRSVFRGFFRELKKPENRNKLIVAVVSCVILGMFIVHMLKPCQCENQEL